MQGNSDSESFQRLNSMTKYPSILTYHSLGDRGRLTEHVQIPFENDDDLVVTEKVDGTNARIIYLPDDDFIIGSREDLLHAKGDRIWVPTEGIVSTIREIAESGHSNLDNVVVVYGEVFGGRTSQHKNYTAHQKTGYRVFDVVFILRPQADEMIANWDRQKIAQWRDNGGQNFRDEAAIKTVSEILKQDTTPRLATIKGKDLPKTVKGVSDWLQQFAKTKCRLDDGAKAKSEGVVVRTHNRSKIAKIRFEDYERTLRTPQPQKK